MQIRCDVSDGALDEVQLDARYGVVRDAVPGVTKHVLDAARKDAKHTVMGVQLMDVLYVVAGAVPNAVPVAVMNAEVAPVGELGAEEQMAADQLAALAAAKLAERIPEQNTASIVVDALLAPLADYSLDRSVDVLLHFPEAGLEGEMIAAQIVELAHLPMDELPVVTSAVEYVVGYAQVGHSEGVLHTDVAVDLKTDA
jgi:hypothetical protein